MYTYACGSRAPACVCHIFNMNQSVSGCSLREYNLELPYPGSMTLQNQDPPSILFPCCSMTAASLEAVITDQAAAVFPTGTMLTCYAQLIAYGTVELK